jgi:nucleoside-diphosphate-sugar epimerase
VNELYDTMAKEAGVKEPAGYVPGRAGELRRNCLDPGRAAIHLGWKPWTSLTEGTGAVLDYFRERRSRGSS